MFPKGKGGFTSICYLTLPGLNDEREEFDELCRFVEETKIDMIQWRNINVDPEYYLTKIEYEEPASLHNSEKLGVRGLMDKTRDKFPGLRFGFFNPCLDETAKNYNLVSFGEASE